MHKKQVMYGGSKLGESPKAMIMVHGRGASAADILSLAAYLEVNNYSLIAPQATNNTWYPYSFMAPVTANEPWLTSALDLLENIVDEIIIAGVARTDIYFLGFSQGACLSLEFVARNAGQYGGIIAFTGGLIGETINRENYTGDFLQTPVFIGTSDPDPHVPVSRVKETTETLTNMNAAVTEKIYANMGHTINEDEIKHANKIFGGLFGFLFIFLSAFSFAQKPFTDVTKQAGINHQFIVYEGSFGGGGVAFDYDNDGLEDLFVAGGKSEDALYKNKGDGTFENVFAKSGLKTDVKYVSQGAASADVNKDGWRDLFVVTINSSANKEKVPRALNILYINNGNGTFRDATVEYGLDKLYSFSTAAMFGDVNNDGYPDIFVGNYFKEYSGKLNLLDDEAVVSSKQSAKAFLLINKEGKSFENEAEAYGINHKGFGFGGVLSDFDNDGDLDLLVNHDFGYKNTPNKFYENKYPEKKFEEVGNKLKMNLPINAMGTAVGDYNNDGLMDYFVTNIRTNYFMVNQGPGNPFINKSIQLGTRVTKIVDSTGIYRPTSWGANFADFDNDGDLDLFVANGCTNPYVEPNPDYYFENVNNNYIDRSNAVNLNNNGIGRGSLYFDYDNDGDLDLFVINQKPFDDDFPTAPGSVLYRNDSAKGNWIKLALLGTVSDKNGIGSRVEITVGDKKMTQEIDGGSSHASQNTVIAHFGLGDATNIDTIRIYWLGGDQQVLVNQKINQLLKITESSKPRSNYSIYWWFLLVPAGIILFYFLKR